jgi:hypothetical protein
MRDNSDEMVALLEQVEQNTAGLGPTATPTEASKGESRPFTVSETSHQPDADADGAVTVAPGESATLASYDVVGVADLLAFGATDHGDSEYELVVDFDSRFATQSPLGLLNTPFSLRKELGYTYPADDKIEFKVNRASSATEAARYAGRIFVSERRRPD